MRGGKVFDRENEQPAHKGPAIIFSEVLCIEWVWGLIGWSGKNIQILILYDRYYLPFWFFVLLWICIYFSQLQFFYIYFSVFCLLFPHLLNTNFSQQVFFFFFFYSIAKISALLSVYIYVYIYLLRILLSLSCIFPFEEIPNQHYGLFWWLRQQRNYLQCRRPGFDFWIRKIQWRKE